MGATDYVALPIPSMRGDVHVLTVWTDRPGGWTAPELEGLHTCLPTFALVVETFESRRLARTILETYLGQRTGPRVLAGQIHRGASERIRAAVWFSDLRSFTDMTRELGDEATVQALDVWFEVAVEAIEDHGGEVLKFIGDALLAIFPVQGDAWGEAVDAAVAAALRIRGREALASGVAIHTGEVLYGNVGAPGRLDFTVLGSAVNKAARVSGLCATLGESIVLSERAAASSSRPLRALGAFPVKGFPEPVNVFAVRD
jgi:adenylate cyclase